MPQKLACKFSFYRHTLRLACHSDRKSLLLETLYVLVQLLPVSVGNSTV
jgi:hypothetical protein